MIRVLLLGAGRWGSNHLRVLHGLPIELFVADVQAKALEAARKLGLPDSHLTTQPRDFFDRIDVAVVATPAQHHFELTRALLELDKDVFVEKPITLTSAEAEQLAQLAERRHRMLQVGHIFRFDPATDWLRESIGRGDFGQVRILRGNFSGFKRPRNDSGVAFADAIHFVDLFNYLLGRNPTQVSAVMHDFLGRGMEDASLISLEYAAMNGPVWATVETNYFLPGKFREVTVVGSDLSAVCDFNVAQYKIKTFQNRHVPKGSDYAAQEGTTQQIECPPEEPLLTELRAFLDSIRTRQVSRADGWAGRAAVRVLEAALESVKRGGVVAFDQKP